MRSDAVLGMARISLSIYSDVAGLCMAVSGKVRQCCAVSGIARKSKDCFVNLHGDAGLCFVWTGNALLGVARIR